MSKTEQDHLRSLGVKGTANLDKYLTNRILDLHEKLYTADQNSFQHIQGRIRELKYIKLSLEIIRKPKEKA